MNSPLPVEPVPNSLSLPGRRGSELSPLPVIPTPPKQRWQQIRNRFLPVLIFVAVLVIVAMLWRGSALAPTLVGQVEPIQANVSSPKAGTLVQLHVTRLQHVKAGDVVAQVITTDPKVVEASLGVIRAEVQLLRVNLHPVLGAQRFSLNYDRLHLDCMDQRVLLATAKVRLQFAQTELHRFEDLFRDKIVAEKMVDQARTNQKRLETEVAERTRIVADLEKNLAGLKLSSTNEVSQVASDPESVLRASIQVQEAKLHLTEAELSPVTLTIPMDGTIAKIQHHSGEAITPGEVILMVNGSNSDRITAYVPQPLRFAPEPGMKVQIRSRALQSKLSWAQVVSVASELESIPSTLFPLANKELHPVGLPFVVSLPSDQRLIPGELVDLIVYPALK
jgi:HlyD family secretion protein